MPSKDEHGRKNGSFIAGCHERGERDSQSQGGRGAQDRDDGRIHDDAQARGDAPYRPEAQGHGLDPRFGLGRVEDGLSRGSEEGSGRRGGALINDLGPEFDDPNGLWEERPDYWAPDGDRGNPEGRFGRILARMKALWMGQAKPGSASRLDGERFISDAEWAALGDSALFEKLRHESRGREQEESVGQRPDGCGLERAAARKGRRCSRRRMQACRRPWPNSEPSRVEGDALGRGRITIGLRPSRNQGGDGDE